MGFGFVRRPEPDQLVVKLDPTTGIRLLLEAQRNEATDPEQINLDMEFAQEGGEGPTPYEVLIHAALVGDSKRFTRQDGIEECWRVMQPLLDNPPPVTLTRRDRGGRTQQTSYSPASGAGTDHGLRNEHITRTRRNSPKSKDGARAATASGHRAAPRRTRASAGPP